MVAALAGIAPAAAAVARQEPVAHAAGAGTVIATKLAEGGANYLIGQLNQGLLGEPGKEVGGFLTKVGLHDDTKEQIAAIRDQLDTISTNLANLGSQLKTVNDKLDQLASAVADNGYADKVLAANTLRADVLTGQDLLLKVLKAEPADRPAAAKEFAGFYSSRLNYNWRRWVGFMTGGGAPGAFGIMQAASKKARAAAKPFFTEQLSMFPRQVYNDYAMIVAIWAEENLNYLSYHGASVEQKLAALDEAKGTLSEMWKGMPPLTVFPNTVIDVRTGLMWTWTVNSRSCVENTKLKTIREINGCYYALGPDPTQAPFGKSPYSKYESWQNVPPTNGNPAGEPGGAWRRPTPAELKALDDGAAGTPASWLAERGGFPARLSGPTWTSENSGDSALTINQSSRTEQWRPKTEASFSLLCGDSGALTVPWFWL